MRQNIVFLTIFGLFYSCSQSNSKIAFRKGLSQTIQNDTPSSKTERQKIIEELKRVQAVFLSNDAQKIADLISFPIPNERFGIYIDNEQFNEQLKKNGNKITRNMFTGTFAEVSVSLQIDQINQLFNYISVDKLLNKDNLEYDAIIKTEPCYHFYKVTVEKQLVTLIVGTNSNKDFKSKSLSKDELQENDSSICEYTLVWVFEFDGKQLHLKEILGAG